MLALKMQYPSPSPERSAMSNQRRSDRCVGCTPSTRARTEVRACRQEEVWATGPAGEWAQANVGCRGQGTAPPNKSQEAGLADTVRMGCALSVPPGGAQCAKLRT